MSLIVISDLHLKNKEPFLSATKQFLNWLVENYNEDEFIFLGDTFDSSAPVWEVYKVFKEFLMQRSHRCTFILQGNHDTSRNKGCSVSSFNLFNNVKIYQEEQEVLINNINCLFLPYKDNYRNYEELAGSYDFIFTHVTPVEAQFANEGIRFPKLKGMFIHGHTHIQKDYKDEFGNKHIILGVPISTRHLEDQSHRLIKIKDDKTIEYIDVPYYFKYETINYSDEPTFKNNILNIKNAPNRKLVYEKYKDYYIRDAGIELLRTEATKEDFNKEFEKSTILDKFKLYAKDKGLSQEVLECCSLRLSKIM